jgi:hypothetical protein
MNQIVKRAIQLLPGFALTDLVEIPRCRSALTSASKNRDGPASGLPVIVEMDCCLHRRGLSLPP